MKSENYRKNPEIRKYFISSTTISINNLFYLILLRIRRKIIIDRRLSLVGDLTLKYGIFNRVGIIENITFFTLFCSRYFKIITLFYGIVFTVVSSNCFFATDTILAL